MDSLTRQISVLTKGVFKELRESREAMASRLSGIQVEIRSVRDQQEAASQYQQQQGQKPQVLHAELQIPEAQQRYQRATNDRQFWVQVALTAVTTLALVAAAIYAGVNYEMLHQMERTMHVDNRAWVGVKTGNAPIAIGNPILKPIAIVNTGKTAAFNLTGAMVVNLLPINEEPDFSYPRHGHPNVEFRVRALMPNAPQEFHHVAALPKRTAPDGTAPAIIVTNKVKQEIDDGSLYIVVHMQITYDDAFGTHHWLRFCEVTRYAVPGIQAKRGVDTCADYNDADRNF